MARLYGTGNTIGMKVYIAGKVSDLPSWEVFIKFAQAEWWLREQGHETVNPLRLCSSKWTWEQCMRVCIQELMKCDAICLLHDWAESRGAVWEYHDAQMLKMPVMVFIPRNGVPRNAVCRDVARNVSTADKTEEL